VVRDCHGGKDSCNGGLIWSELAPISRVRGHARFVISRDDQIHIRQVRVPTKGLEDWHDARGGVVPVEEDGAVVCEVERAVVDLPRSRALREAIREAI
jgi:hypothetical protein